MYSTWCRASRRRPSVQPTRQTHLCNQANAAATLTASSLKQRFQKGFVFVASCSAMRFNAVHFVAAHVWKGRRFLRHGDARVELQKLDARSVCGRMASWQLDLRWLKCRLANVSTGSPPKTSPWPPSTRKRPGVVETGTFLAKRAGLPYLLRETSRHLPDCAESRELESRRIGLGRSLKVRIGSRNAR